MENKNVKIQIYMATSIEEYDKALAWVKKKRYGKTIKEVGRMDSTDYFGEHIDVYVFLFSASNRSMAELAKYMKVQCIPFESQV